jgi:hypothetical protein
LTGDFNLTGLNRLRHTSNISKTLKNLSKVAKYSSLKGVAQRLHIGSARRAVQSRPGQAGNIPNFIEDKGFR